jgi:hypothetical protein
MQEKGVADAMIKPENLRQNLHFRSYDPLPIA